MFQVLIPKFEQFLKGSTSKSVSRRTTEQYRRNSQSAVQLPSNISHLIHIVIISKRWCAVQCSATNTR